MIFRIGTRERAGRDEPARVRARDARGARGVARSAGAVALAVCAALPIAPVWAHDFWIEPSAFRPQVGDSVAIRLREGEHLVGELLPLVPATVRRFTATVGGVPLQWQRHEGHDPAASVHIGKAGLLVLGYHSRAYRIDLPAEKFNAYLAEEGLEAIIELRARRGQSTAPAREHFVRCAKSLLMVGTPGESGDEKLGLTLELHAERNPHALPDDGELPVRLTYQGQALAGALVVAMNTLDPATRQSARSDADGRVRFRVKPGGMWLVKAVHMVEAPRRSGVDWLSHWASLTFAVPRQPAATRPSLSRRGFHAN